MTYGVEGIDAVESWTASSEYADDLALDIDVTACMLNGVTTGTSCDEWKEGVLNCKVVIDYPPGSILTLSVRFWCDEAMTTGDQALVPYTDSDSVSSTNAVVETYDTSDVWVEHVCDAAFIAELGDVGGGKCGVRLAATALAKTKLAEVNIDITVYTFTLAGVTYDLDEVALGSVEYNVFRRSSMAPETWVLKASGTSHATTGAYSEELSIGTYRVIGVKDVEPQVFDLLPPLIAAQATAADDEFALGVYHGLANDDQVWIYQCGSAALPTGVSEDTLYHVVNLSGDTCELSTSQGGSAVNITVDGDCWIVGKPAES